MVEAKAQAAQLDSVTDVVQEQEVDATRAQQAMSAFLSDGGAANSGHPKTNNDVAATTSTVATLNSDLQQKLSITSANTAVTAVVRPEDVQLICSELDVTEDVATQALRNAANDLADTVETNEKDALIVLALRKLITS